MVFELWRIAEENRVLREKLAQYEADVEKLVATSQLGHQNAKQKLQYHLRYLELCSLSFMALGPPGNVPDNLCSLLISDRSPLMDFVGCLYDSVSLICPSSPDLTCQIMT